MNVAAWSVAGVLAVALAAGISVVTVVGGVALGLAAQWLMRELPPARLGGWHPRRLARRAALAVLAAAHQVGLLLRANALVVQEVITPRRRLRAGVVALPLDPAIASDVAVAMVANQISLSPDSTVIELSADGRTLYVHVLFLPESGDLDEIRATLRNDYERRVVELLR